MISSRDVDKRNFISQRGTELCVICHADTHIPDSKPVSERYSYVDGVGQCCAACAADEEPGTCETCDEFGMVVIAEDAA